MSRSATPARSKAGWEHFPHHADVGVRGWCALSDSAATLKSPRGRTPPQYLPCPFRKGWGATAFARVYNWAEAWLEYFRSQPLWQTTFRQLTAIKAMAGRILKRLKAWIEAATART